MQWNDFIAKVLSQLGEDPDDPNPVKQRGINQYVRSAVVRMQSVVSAYREGHENIYTPSSLTKECYAAKGVLPDGARPTEIWRHGVLPEDLSEEESGSEDGIPADCERRRVEVHPVPWSDRTSMIDGTTRVRNIIAFDSQFRTFYLSPPLLEGETLHVFWNGKKMEFAEDESLPWGEEAVDYVSQYAAAQLERVSRDKLNQYQTFAADAAQSLALLEQDMKGHA